ncbi:MAG: TolC family protein [Gemmatimonadetes bacterium]|nr:TolC family protein [Gemmatimonadota bacterium]
MLILGSKAPTGWRTIVRGVLGVQAALGAVIADHPPLLAQDRGNPTVTAAAGQAPALLLGDLYRDVRRENPRAEAARALTRAAEARVPGSKRPPDPQVQFGFMNYTVPGLKPMDPLGMAQLQVMQMVPVAGKLSLAGKITSSQALAQRERANEVEWESRTQAAMAFYDLYQTDQALLVARETLRLLQDLQRTAEAMYRVGEGRQADVLRAQVEVARMTEDTIRMQTMRLGMRARINALLNRAGDASIAPPEVPAFPDSVLTLGELAAAAERGRPMVRAGERDLEAADAGSTLARRELWPDLTLGIQYGQRSGLMNTERMGSLMVGASVPVFARSRQLRMREEASAMQAMARADLVAMRSETRGRVTEAFANLVRARNLIALYRHTVMPQAEATVTSSLAAYRVGSVNFMTALDSRMTVNRYRQELFTLVADEGKSWAELEMLLGRELFNPPVSAGVTEGKGGTR